MKKKIITMGLRDGLPIGLGYFAVAFSLGILAKKTGLNAVQGFFTSFFVRASAGEYSGYTMIQSDAPYLAAVVMCVIANLRYLLMSTALTQKIKPGTPLGTRLLTGICITDEVFGISIAYPGYLEPLYTYTAMLLAGIMWASGTAMGIIAGSVLPAKLVSALSVALYGMFLAIIVPPAKKDRTVAFSVAAAFALSWLGSVIPAAAAVSSGVRTIVLTIIISAAAAALRPVKDGEGGEHK